MKFSELKNRAVVDLNSARNIGHVESLVLDPALREVVGLKVKSGGLFGSGEMIPKAQIQNVGQDAITIAQPMEAAVAADSSSKKETDPLKALPDLSAIIGKQVVTQGGKLIGEISDVVLEPTNFAITGYEVSEAGLFGKKHQLPTSEELNLGPKILIVPDQLAVNSGMLH